MAALNTIFFTPHPPVIVPEVGKGDERLAKKTVDGMKKVARGIGEAKPEVIIYLTPHGNMFSSELCLLDAKSVTGDLLRFGADVKFTKRISDRLLNGLYRAFDTEGVPYIAMNMGAAENYAVTVSLDHGVLVPMYFIDEVYPDYEIIHVSPGFLPADELWRIGKIVRQTVEKTGLETTVVASGDLSHCLKPDGPYGYKREGEAFDAAVNAAFLNNRPYDLLHINSKIVREAGECGLRPFVLALGMADGYRTETTVFSYEGPYGVGYMTAMVRAGEKETETPREKKESDPYVALAKEAIAHYVVHHEMLVWETYRGQAGPAFRREVEERQAGAFVSIHKNGRLRGCIGTIAPTKHSLAEEIIYAATQACGHDPRFQPVRAEELSALDVKVDVLRPPEKADDVKDLDEKRYGVIVSKDIRRGLLLPNLDGVDSVGEQIAIAKRKAGIHPDDQDVRIERFEVIRHEE